MLKNNPEYLAFPIQVSPFANHNRVLAPANLGPGSYSKKVFNAKKEQVERPIWGNEKRFKPAD